MAVLRKIRPRDELGWRVPRPGTIAADIYALAKKGLSTGEIAKAKTADPVKKWVLYWYEKLQIEAWARVKKPRPKSVRWLCKNSDRTRNFGLYGHAESKKKQKFVFRSALRPIRFRFHT